ncbi:MAG: DUF559 domain-containing protein [Patescibacteria group bacterium]
MPIMIHHTPKQVHLRKILRGSMIKSERLLWSNLRARRLRWKFRRQHSIGSYILMLRRAYQCKLTFQGLKLFKTCH